MKTKTLINALSLARTSLGSNNSALPILSHFCFADDIVIAYNDVTAVIVNEPTGLDCALHGDTLMGILDAAGTEEIKVKNGGDGVIQLDTGNGWVKVPSLPSEAFVFTLPEEEETLAAVPLSKEVLKALELAMISVGSDTLKPEFSGITVIANKDGLVMYSTDNITASRYKPEGKFMPKRSFALVLPAEACQQIIKFGKDRKGLKLELGWKIATIQSDGDPPVTLISKLLQAKPEQFVSVFSTHTEGIKQVGVPEGIAKEITKAVVLTGREQVKECYLRFGGGALQIETAGQLGAMRTTVAADRTLEGTVLIDPNMVARILPYCDRLWVNDRRSLVFGNAAGLTHIVSSKHVPDEAVA